MVLAIEEVSQLKMRIKELHEEKENQRKVCSVGQSCKQGTIFCVEAETSLDCFVPETATSLESFLRQRQWISHCLELETRYLPTVSSLTHEIRAAVYNNCKLGTILSSRPSQCACDCLKTGASSLSCGIAGPRQCVVNCL